jgi:hypothetical protein
MKTVLSSIGGQSVSKAYDEAHNSDATAPLQSGAVGTSGHHRHRRPQGGHSRQELKNY